MRIFITLVLTLSLMSCATPPVQEYAMQEQIAMGSYASLGITDEMKSRLSDAFREQVDWEDYDGRTAEMALKAMEAELIYVSRTVNETGTMNYYSASESSKKLRFWAAQMFQVLDKVSLDGAVDTDTSLIYYFVRERVNANLRNLSISLDKAAASINSKASGYTVNQFKDFAENLIPFVTGLL